MPDMNAEEQKRIQQLLVHEKELWRQGCRFVAGVDEAGRGPLAGPVVAAAVVFFPTPEIPLIDDSKKLNEKMRDLLFGEITHKAGSYGIGVAEVEEIDRLNIFHASLLAMRRALERLSVQPEHILVDGNAFSHETVPFTTLVKGDARCYSIAAASILAKVTRDRMMLEYDQQYPQYGFCRHKGYATDEHLNAIEEYGYCPLHRRSFNPKRFQLKLDLFPGGHDGVV